MFYLLLGMDEEAARFVLRVIYRCLDADVEQYPVGAYVEIVRESL